jgi:hypothetical protein
MNPFKLYGGGAALLVVMIAIGIHFAGDARVRHRLADTTKALVKTEGEAATVLVAARKASDNPDLKWADTAGQVDLVGKAVKAYKGVVDIQSAQIDALGIETAQLKTLAAAERRKADVAIAKRKTLIDRLQDDALTPGDRSDCARQLREIEAVLDAVFEGGL